jgi:hypothetical protein
MNTETQEKVSEDSGYRLIKIEKTEPPEGMPDGEWYHYVIGQGRSKIEGIRPGTLKAVTRHAEDFAENLNTRTRSGYSTYSARKQQKKAD